MFKKIPILAPVEAFDRLKAMAELVEPINAETLAIKLRQQEPQ